ncbi:MAG: hypothetical protein ACRDPL_17630, partial [Propionibacteriaceae bacterium]
SGQLPIWQQRLMGGFPTKALRDATWASRPASIAVLVPTTMLTEPAGEGCKPSARWLPTFQGLAASIGHR